AFEATLSEVLVLTVGRPHRRARDRELIQPVLDNAICLEERPVPVAPPGWTHLPLDDPRAKERRGQHSETEDVCPAHHKPLLTVKRLRPSFRTAMKSTLPFSKRT